jgi:hypothetical protein
MILVFGAIGLARIFRPDKFMGRPGINGQSRTLVRSFGVVFIVLAAFMVYLFLADTFLASRHGV